VTMTSAKRDEAGPRFSVVCSGRQFDYFAAHRIATRHEQRT
jgi:hypothetical protein